MIQVSAALKSLLASGQYLRADLYDVTLVNGTTLHWSTWPLPITTGGNTYSSRGVNITRDKWSIKIGLEVSTFNVTVGVDPNNEPTVNGVPLRQAARAGLFDYAKVTMSWAYFDASNSLIGTIPRLFGHVGAAIFDRVGMKLPVN